MNVNTLWMAHCHFHLHSKGQTDHTDELNGNGKVQSTAEYMAGCGYVTLAVGGELLE